ncbi:MAG: pyruvate ferredoxin oxidoreductase [Beggiatoa sp. IS2]|nr:MAG: pyruvate ferredoxin oxidoreductase [Beggiatoa sp. IS2]
MSTSKKSEFKYPGIRDAMDGNTAVIMCERESSDAAGAYPITPSTQMGEFWAEEVGKGHINISGRPLIFIEPEGEHAAAAVTAGLAMTGLRATNFSSSQGVAYMHESLYAAVGKRLTYILNIGTRAITKASLNVHCGHDDYHAIDDTGFFQIFGKDAQGAADLNVIGHKIAELSLTPGAVAQDGFLTTHLIETLRVPERELIAEYLGYPDDIIDTPTPAQRLLYGEKRRRIPIIWDVDNPVMSGTAQNQDSYMQSVAAQRPYFFDHIADIADKCMEEYYRLTGRRYGRINTYRTEDAEYLIIGQGSIIPSAEIVADYLRDTRGLKVGVVNMTMYRPFPGDLIGEVVKGRKGVAVLERTDQPLSEDLPIMREIRTAVTKCVENGNAGKGALPFPKYATYSKPQQVPALYSASFGLGSRDLQPEGIIGTIENMLPDGKKKKFFYLGIDFARKEPFTPKQEIHQQHVLDAYPGVRDLAIRGSENPNLLPKDSTTVRFHSVGGWGAITTGKNLAMTLYELLDFDIKANPKYGSEKKGQPTTYYLTAAPERIRLNCEYAYVDVVMSPDPNVFGHSNPLSGLKKGGVYITQSSLATPEAVWRSFPIEAQKYIVDNEIRVFYVDAFKIAKAEASDPELQFRMQGIAFQGAFFAASPIMKTAKLTDEKLFKAIKDQLQSKFGGKGARVVEDNLRVVRRGFEELKEITDKKVGMVEDKPKRKESAIPVMLKRQPANEDRISDIHRFWEQTGNFYVAGKGNDNLADPFIALSLVPASTGFYRDMTQIRFDYPVWLPDKCTACGDCYTLCPDSSIPGLVSTVAEVMETTVKRVESKGRKVKHLRRAVRTVEQKMRTAMTPVTGEADARPFLTQAMNDTLAETELKDAEKEELVSEFEWFKEAIGDFKFNLNKPYFGVKEKEAKGSGGLFSITVNPYTCKGCMECVTTCDDGALAITTQTTESVEMLRKDWNYWLDLPNTSETFNRIENLDERVGALQTLMLDKKNYDAMGCGDGACLGCGEKTIIHLFVSTITALLQPRIKKHLEHIDSLVAGLEKHIRLKLTESMDVGDVDTIEKIVNDHADVDLTLSRLSSALESKKLIRPVDTDWLKWVSQLLGKLKEVKWRYVEGVTKQGRANLGFINSTGCTTVWASTFPYNPYPFPWSNHLFQDSPSMAMGIFAGHMAKMADGFKAIRMAELELAGEYNVDKHQHFFTYFDWQDFSDEEFALCPPIVSVGGDGAMYDIGFQNLSRMLASGTPIKVLIVDTQVYSNTGGQNCTSGFIGQVSDMAPYGKEAKGKEEIRKEISLIGLAHRTAYIHQSSISNISHLLEGFVEGLNARRPALFNIYAVCQPEHGVADDASEKQSKLAVDSRAYPLFRFNPDKGITIKDCCDMEGNANLEDDWITYTLNYVDENGKPATMELPMTFADFALSEGRFRKHFRSAPRNTWDDEKMVPMLEFVNMSADEQEGLFPYVWAVDRKNQLTRVIPSAEIVKSTKERRDFWRLLKGLSGLDATADPEQIANNVRVEMAQKLSAGLLSLMSGGGTSGIAAALTVMPSGGAAIAEAPSAAGFQAAWIESSECTACDECTKINSKIFAYDSKKKAYVKDPKAGPFKDIVKAAEKCPVKIIHPGTPANPNEKDVDKLVKRAAKFQ